MFWTPTSSAFFSFKSDQETESPQDPESEKQVNDYNDRAVGLFEQGQFEEAQELWEKALEILEHPVAYVQEDPSLDSAVDAVDEELIFTESEGGTDRNSINKLYDTAVSLFKKEKYVASKKMFERIEAIIPDYKASRNYLTILDHKIRKAQQNLSGKSFKENAVARREERAEWERILGESRMELEKKLAEQVDPLYREAIDYYKKRKFNLAKDYFTEVNGILPGYKDTNKYLSRINKDIRGEDERLMEERRKREILARKKEKEEWNRILQESGRELQKKLIEQVNPVYEEALHHYKKRQFELAKIRFEESHLIVPNYKSTAKYLERIERDLQGDARLRQERRARELEQKKREEELARRREERRLEASKEAKEKARLDRFKMEVATRRKERQDWLKALEESEKERQQKLKEQVRFVYQEAVKYYKKRKFEQAKEDFLEVRRIYPNYKSTEKYLARVDKDIEEDQKQRYEEHQRAFQRRMREKKLLEQQKWEEDQRLRAVEEQDRLRGFNEKALARKQQREEWEQIIQENERQRQKKLEEEAEFVYQEALRSYHAKRWEEARGDFTEVARILPGYKLTEKYLSGIDDDIQRHEQKRRRIAREDSEQRSQKEALERKQEEKRLAKQRKAAQKKEIQRKEVQAEAVYQFAMSLYKRGNYAQAKDKFLEVEQVLSGYRSTKKYLRNIDRDIEKAEESRQKKEQIAFERQIREQRLAQQREEDRLERLRATDDERRLLKLSEEALLRERERREWEKTIQAIEREHKKRLEHQTDSVYEEALRYYKAGWFEQSKETLEEVDAMWPGYKSTEKYLARVDSAIRKNRRLRRESEDEIVARQKWQEKLARQKKDAQQRHLRKSEEQKRIKELKKETLARQEEKERLKGAMEEIEREHQKRAQKKARALYRTALKYYKAGGFEKAKIAFIDVEKTSPGYRSTIKYLARLDDDIKDESLAMGKRAVQSQGGYADASDFPMLEKNGDKFVERASQERQKEFSRDAEVKYREALALYKAKEFIRAKLKFIEVESLSPGYKSTLDYLGRIDKDIGENQRSRMEQEVDKPKEKADVFKGQEPPAIGQRRGIVEQALWDAERSFRKPAPQEIIKPRRKEQRNENEPPIDWERRIHERRKELGNQRRKVQQEYERQFRQLYTRAVKLYRSGSYEESRALFLQIEQMKPGYKKAASYLKKAEAKIRKGLQRRSRHSVVLQPQEIKTRNNIVEEALNVLEQKL
ncbi:MAG: hypothetical protein KAJ70_01750 [Candidatus Omnitrophica bacterium]|nr:hypothetical protein [Candidatus Omnitrophota bacterium]